MDIVLNNALKSISVQYVQRNIGRKYKLANDKSYIKPKKDINIGIPLLDSGKPSCIDNFFVKTKLSIFSLRLTINITDHFPLFLALNEKLKTIKQKDQFVNNNKLLNLSYTINGKQIMKHKNQDNNVDFIVNEINEIIKAATGRLNRKKQTIQSWINQNTLKLINKKESLYKLWRQNFNDNALK